MPKSRYTGLDLFAKLKKRQWAQQQDFKAKYERLSQKQQTVYTELADSLNSQFKEKKPKQPKIDKSKPASPPSSPEPNSPNEKKSRNHTGYSVYAKAVREKAKERAAAEAQTVEQIPAKVLRERYAQLPPEKRERCEAHAAKLNAAKQAQ